MNLRTRTLIFGGVIGALLGVGAAYLFLRSTPIEVDEEGREKLPPVNPGDAIKLALGVMTVLKQITGLGGGGDEGGRRRKGLAQR